MHFRSCHCTTFLLITIYSFAAMPFAAMASPQQADGLDALEGEWLYVEDRTKDRDPEKQGPPMSTKFQLRTEENAVVMLRGNRPEQRLALDGSTTEVAKATSISKYTSRWADDTLVFETEIVRKDNGSRIALIRMEFSPVEDGLLVRVPSGDVNQVALYRHPEDIELPTQAEASIQDMAWLAGDWIGTGRKTATEERWGPASGGSMLGTSRTIRNDKMVGFEFLRIVERDSGLVYVAQPGGKPPTEFSLVKISGDLAVFENPRHDFPQRIKYELSGNGQLSASIGFINGGRPTSFQFVREVSR